MGQVSDKSSGMYSPGLHSACGEELGFPLAVVLVMRDSEQLAIKEKLWNLVWIKSRLCA